MSLRVIFSSFHSCLGVLSLHVVHAWHAGQGRSSLSGRAGADLKPQDQGSASAGREKREGGRGWPSAERAWGKILKPLGQSCCQFPGSLSLTPCPVGQQPARVLTLTAGSRAVALASAICCPACFLTVWSQTWLRYLSPLSWKVTHKQGKQNFPIAFFPFGIVN